MRGIKSISEELNAIVERLDPSQYSAVVDIAMRLSLDDFATDEVVRTAIEACRSAALPSNELADHFRRQANDSDAHYLDLELQPGREHDSRHMFRRMCVFNALTALATATEVTLHVLDEFLYDIGHGASSTEEFGAAMVQALTA